MALFLDVLRLTIDVYSCEEYDKCTPEDDAWASKHVG
jgi:hypothetical protein